MYFVRGGDFTVTYKKIAEEAGVSESTVSKALSGSSEISFSTVEKIRSIACELGYYSDKRALRREYSRDFKPHIAIICPELISVFYTTIAEDLIDIITRSGGRATVMISRFGREEIMSIAESVACNSDFDGIISTNVFAPSKKLNIPTVFLGKSRQETEFDCLYCGMEHDIETAVKYLVSQGHETIGFGGEMLTLQKEKIFREVVRKKGLLEYDGYILRVESRFFEAGVECYRKFKRRNLSLPDAMIFAYDEIAVGFMDEAKKDGVKIPEDLSIVGINNTRYCSYITPTLTSVSNWRPKIAEKAYELLISRILGSISLPQDICYESELVERQSVKRRK